MDIKNILPVVKRNVLLKNHTTFKIGGKADYFFEAKTKEDLIKAVKAAKKAGLVFFILGRGSNVLFSDQGFRGLIIKFHPPDYVGVGTSYKFQVPRIYVGAGVKLGDIVKASAEKSLTGLEWAAGIPGTIGGAVRGDAGAFGFSMANVVEKVEVFDCGSLKIKNFSPKECGFFYRESIFKKKKKLIILSAVLKLKKGNKKEIEKKIKECLNYRKTRHPLDFPSAGSVFKNYELNPKDKKLLNKFPELKEFGIAVSRVRDTNQNQFSGANSGKIQGARSDAMPQGIVSDEQRRRLPEFARPKGSQKMDDFCVVPPQRSVKLPSRRRALKSSHFLASKADSGSDPAPLRTGKKIIPAGFFIEKCGLRGKKIGRARISEKHCNFIINLGGAKAKDVIGLIKLVKQKVKDKFGIELEEEIKIVK